jgi:medium-chain acyl-[acyl-carrier-protein] hydrolase
LPVALSGEATREERMPVTNLAPMSRWLSIPRPNPTAAVRLFCLPHAGGGSAIFRRWPAALPANIEVCLVRLPGREARLREPPFTRLEPLVATLADILRPLLDRPFAFFGHSMGALVAFELARHVRARCQIAPRHLFVSARRAPQCASTDPFLHVLPEAEFRRAIRELGGTPEQVLADEELLSLLLPAVRADFTVAETYAYGEEPPLDCPITAFGGRDDPRVGDTQLDAWRQQTRRDFRRYMFPGGHFFIHSAEAPLLDVLALQLSDTQSTTGLPPV